MAVHLSHEKISHNLVISSRTERNAYGFCWNRVYQIKKLKISVCQKENQTNGGFLCEQLLDEFQILKGFYIVGLKGIQIDELFCIQKSFYVIRKYPKKDHGLKKLEAAQFF